MLSTCGIPHIDDGQAIRDAAFDLGEAADAVTTRASTIRQQWSAMSALYRAPEQHEVLAAMDPPVTTATAIEEKTRSAVSALMTYGDECDVLRRRRADLLADVDAFNDDLARTESNPVSKYSPIPTPGYQSMAELAVREQELVGRIERFRAEVDEAQRRCANDLSRLDGGPRFAAADATDVNTPSVSDWTPGDKGGEYSYGLGPRSYRQVTRTGEAPWGSPSTWRSANPAAIAFNAGRGIYVSADDTVAQLDDLRGFNGPGPMRAAWSGMRQLGLDLSAVQSPGMDAPPEAEERVTQFGKSVVSYDTWSTDPAGTGGAFLPDVALTVASAVTTGGAAGAAKLSMSSLLRSVATRSLGNVAKAGRALTTPVDIGPHAAAWSRAFAVDRLGPRPAYAGVPGSGLRRDRPNPFGALYNESSGAHDKPLPRRGTTGHGAGAAAPARGSRPSKGIPEVMSSLKKSTGKAVWEADDLPHLVSVFQQLAGSDAAPSTLGGHPGTVYQQPGGSKIAWRPTSSSGGETIDIRGTVDGREIQWKVHLPRRKDG